MFRSICLALAMIICAVPAFAAQKTYIVASDATWPPMELLNDKKAVIGYSTDYINAVAKEANLKIEVRNIAWDGIFAGLAAGTCDVIASSVTITDERKKQFDFTTPYYEVHQAVLVPAGSNIKSLAELKDKVVGGQIGTTGIFVMQEAKVGAKLKEYEDIGLAMEDLANKRLDAVICDDPVAMYYANKNKNFSDKFKLALTTPDVEHYGFVVQKNKKELLAALNKGVKAVKDKGIEAELIKKWMGSK